MAFNNSTKKKKDYFQDVTDNIIEEMEKGNLPWQKAWDSKVGLSLVGPMNGTTHRNYTKENLIRGMIKMSQKQSNDPRFFTMRNIKANGWGIRPGAKGMYIKQGFFATKDLMGNPLPSDECHWTSTYSICFHASDLCQSMTYVKDKEGKQLYKDVLDENGKIIWHEMKDKNGKPILIEKKNADGSLKLNEDGSPMLVPKMAPLREPVIEFDSIPEYVPEKKYTHDEQIDIAESILNASGAKIFHDRPNEAFYSLDSDEIHLPPKEAFPSILNYYATALHELAHWTGHPIRLNRFTEENKDMRSEGYAKEELRAEMASVYLSAALEIPMNTQNHAAYVKNWLNALKSDKMEFFKAANDAKKITSYVLDFVKDKIKLDDVDIKIDSDNKDSNLDDIISVNDAINVNNFSTIRIFKAPVDAPWHGKNFGDAMIDAQLNPENRIVFGKYFNTRHYEFQTVHRSTKLSKNGKETFGPPIKMAINEILDAVYKENTGIERSSEQAMDSLDLGDIISVDERYFYINGMGFQEILPVAIGNQVNFKPVESQEIAQTIAMSKEIIGEEKFNQFKTAFHEIFYKGHNIESENCDFISYPYEHDVMVGAYQKFIYDNAVKFNLSGIRPCDDKSWEDADSAFMDYVLDRTSDEKVNMLALANAATVLQEFSPYAKISDKTNMYAQNMLDTVMKSEKYHNISSKSVEPEIAAAIGIK